ncbi:18719_t:CDS:1, partial [Gigaspora margarita]
MVVNKDLPFFLLKVSQIKVIEYQDIIFMTVLKGIAINFTIIALSISNFITLGTGLEIVVNNKSMLQSIVQ